MFGLDLVEILFCFREKCVLGDLCLFKSDEKYLTFQRIPGFLFTTSKWKSG